MQVRSGQVFSLLLKEPFSRWDLIFMCFLAGIYSYDSIMDEARIL